VSTRRHKPAAVSREPCTVSVGPLFLLVEEWLQAVKEGRLENGIDVALDARHGHFGPYCVRCDHLRDRVVGG